MFLRHEEQGEIKIGGYWKAAVVVVAVGVAIVEFRSTDSH
jgi:hypothetical protein